MPEEVKLLPCPFCGCDQDIEKNVSASGTVWFSCDTCGASGPFHDDEKTAADRWNRRAPEPDELEVIQKLIEGLEDIQNRGSYLSLSSCINILKEAERLFRENRREDTTSVIRWTRYDGTPETLPDFGDKVLLTKTSQRKFYPVTAEFEIFGGLKVWNDFTNRMDVHIGDLWAYLPEPPEGME